MCSHLRVNAGGRCARCARWACTCVLTLGFAVLAVIFTYAGGEVPTVASSRHPQQDPRATPAQRGASLTSTRQGSWCKGWWWCRCSWWLRSCWGSCWAWHQGQGDWPFTAGCSCKSCEGIGEIWEWCAKSIEQSRSLLKSGRLFSSWRCNCKIFSQVHRLVQRKAVMVNVRKAVMVDSLSPPGFGRNTEKGSVRARPLPKGAKSTGPRRPKLSLALCRCVQ